MMTHGVKILVYTLTLSIKDDNGQIDASRLIVGTSYFDVYKQLRQNRRIEPYVEAHIESTPDIGYYEYIEATLDRSLYETDWKDVFVTLNEKE